MDIFKDISKKVVTASKDAIKMTQNLTEVASKKSKISDLNNLKLKKFEAMGEFYYQNYAENPMEAFQGIIQEIQMIVSEIGRLENEIAQIQGTVKCTNCGSEFGKNVNFCPDCGQKNIVEEVAVEVESKCDRCSVCNAELEENVKFCGSCGNKIVKE